MVALSRPKCLSRAKRCDNRSFENSALFKGFKAALSEALLFWRQVKDGGAILWTSVCKLSVGLCGVNGAPKGI
jgi:hypothetical protein